MNVDETWAYRARRQDPLVAVEVLRTGTKRPLRVLVRFVSDEFEGREEWVPPARLKTPWRQVDAFIVKEKRWAAVADASLDGETAEDFATHLVFDELIDPELAELRYRTPGVAAIADVDRLARFLDIDAAELRGHPLAFEEDGALIVPWPITELIARRAAERDPDPLLRHVDKSEAEQRRKMMHGEYYRLSRRDPERYLEPEHFVETDEHPYNRPSRELVRQWCGADAVERRDELIELRKEVARLARLVEDATAALRRAGADSDAVSIERDLGVRVETLKDR